MDNRAIIKGCKAENSRAQKALVMKFSGLLFTICRRYAYREMDAKDMLQEAFVHLFDKIDKYDSSKGKFEDWIKRLTINVVLQQNRKIKIIPLELDDSFDTNCEQDVESSTGSIDKETILARISELPQQYRMIFNMYVVDGFNHNEIADYLNISPSTSRSNLSRATRILKNKINNVKNKRSHAK